MTIVIIFIAKKKKFDSSVYQPSCYELDVHEATLVSLAVHQNNMVIFKKISLVFDSV